MELIDTLCIVNDCWFKHGYAFDCLAPEIAGHKTCHVLIESHHEPQQVDSDNAIMAFN